MFEYTSKKDCRVTINPRMVTVILEPEDGNGCSIYTADGPDPIIVTESYDKVRDDFNNHMYSMHTTVSM